MFGGSGSNQVERMIARRGVSLSREKMEEGYPRWSCAPETHALGKTSFDGRTQTSMGALKGQSGDSPWMQSKKYKKRRRLPD